MSPSRPDLVAPRWLVHLFRANPAPIPWARAARAAVIMAVPVAIGYLTGGLGFGGLAATGALPSVTTDVSGTYRARALRLVTTLGAADVGFALGLLTGGNGIASAILVIGVAGLSALISAAGSVASVASLQLFIFTVLATAPRFADVPIGFSLLFFVAGSVWGLLVALSGWTVRATSPERDAVADVYIELAAMLSALATHDQPTTLAARQQLTRAMNTAYDRLLTARSWLSGRDATYRALLNLLSASTPAIEAATALVDSRTRPPPDVIDHVTALATAVLAHAPLPEPPRSDSDDPKVSALYDALAKIGTEEERSRRDRVPLRRRLGDWLGTLRSGPLTWVAAARLMLCVTLAEIVILAVPLERQYWITLTVGIVLKPDFGSVFGRAVLRGVGTVAGVGLGALVLALGAHGFWLVFALAVFAAGAAIGKVRSHGLLATFITPLIIVLMDLTTGGSWTLVFARLIDTVLGCVIVLVFGYLLWPGSRRPRVGGRLADVTDTVARYIDVALRPVTTPQERAERSRRRRQAYRGLSDLRTAFQQVIVEPSQAGRQARGGPRSWLSNSSPTPSPPSWCPTSTAPRCPPKPMCVRWRRASGSSRRRSGASGIWRTWSCHGRSSSRVWGTSSSARSTPFGGPISAESAETLPFPLRDRDIAGPFKGMNFNDLKNRAQQALGKNSDKIEQSIDKASGYAKSRFGKQSGKIDTATQKAKEFLRKNTGGDGGGQQPPGQQPPPPPGQ